MPMNAVLAIYQGTNSTKSLVIYQDGTILGTSSPESYHISPRYPRSGWVEYDPFQMLDSVRHGLVSSGWPSSGYGGIEVLSISYLIANFARCVD